METEEITVRKGFVDALDAYIQDMPYRWAKPLAEEVAKLRALTVSAHADETSRKGEEQTKDSVL